MRDAEIINSNNDAYSQENSSKFVGKVFGYMGVGLFITTLVCVILNFLFSRVFPIVDTSDAINNQNAVIYLALLIGSLVSLLIVSIWIRFTTLFSKKGRSVVVPYSIYAILMGVMMSSLTLFVDGYIIAITLAITFITFGVMFLIGYTAKSNLSTLAIVGSGLAIGAFLIVMMNLFIFWFFPVYATLTTWLASGIIFVAMMLFTIVDIRRIKEIADSGMNNNNIALYCAFTLYVDFIYMFIRILRIVIILFGRKK